MNAKRSCVWHRRIRSAARWAILGWCVVAPLQAMARLGLEIVDLGTLGGEASVAQGLNNLGQVVGWSNSTTGARRAFLYSDGTMTDLGTLPGGTTSRATAINNVGQITGESGINAFGPFFREFVQAFVWQNGSMQSLGALYCPCSFNTRYGISTAWSINDLGQIVGWSETVRGRAVHHAFLGLVGSMQDIGAGSWSISHAYSINDFGQIVGDFAQDAGLSTEPYDRRAFLWQNGVRQDLGTLPGHTSSAAIHINANSQIVGWSGAPDGTVSRAVLWQDGTIRDLGTLHGDPSSQALSINNVGVVVGWSGTSDRTASRAFVWWRGMMLDLNLLVHARFGWVLTEATAINDVGQIAGTGLHNGRVRAYLLTPR